MCELASDTLSETLPGSEIENTKSLLDLFEEEDEVMKKFLGIK